MKKLTYGMVGGGPGAFIGDVHRHAMDLDRLAELKAGCFSRSPEKSAEFGRELEVPEDRCYGSYEEMARAEASRPDGIDFVTVVTPNVSHYPICKAFLEAGIHVACDKPLCLTVEEAEELCTLADSRGLLFMVTYTYMGHITAKHVKHYVESGKLGKIRTVMAEYPQGWLGYEGPCGGKQGQWRCDPRESGGVNCLGDLGTHVENAVSTMTGLKITRVLARMDSMVPGRVLDDNDVILVEYEGGATGVYWSSQIAIGQRNNMQIRIYGENGSVIWQQEQSEKVTIIDKDGTAVDCYRGSPSIDPAAGVYNRMPTGHSDGFLEAMANLYKSFTDCILAKKNGTFREDMIDFPTVHEGAEGIRFVHACLRSNAAGNTWVAY